MKQLLKEIRHNPLLWLLAFVPAVSACHKLKPESHTLLFVLSVLAIAPWRRCSVMRPNPWPPKPATPPAACSTPRSET